MALILFIRITKDSYEDKENNKTKWESRFGKALSKVKVTVSFNEKMDETTELCEYIIPTHHYLESWGDAEIKSRLYRFHAAYYLSFI